MEEKLLPAQFKTQKKRAVTKAPEWTPSQIDDILNRYVKQGISVNQIAKDEKTAYYHVRNLLSERGVLKQRVGTVILVPDKQREASAKQRAFPCNKVGQKDRIPLKCHFFRPVLHG